MSNTKTVFRTLAQEVHPDHGGTSAQFIEIMKYRNDYDRLVALASKWGIKLNGIDTSKSYQENLEAVVGALIRHTFSYKRFCLSGRVPDDPYKPFRGFSVPCRRFVCSGFWPA